MFDILKLPREIRDMIYDYALVVKGISVKRIDQAAGRAVLRSSWATLPPSQRNVVFDDLYGETYRAQFDFDLRYDVWLPLLSLFLTNRQIYTESSQLFYEHNHFRFDLGCLANDDLESYRAFWHDRPLTAKAYIRHLHLDFDALYYGKFASFSSHEYVACDELDEVLDCESLDTLEICLSISRVHPLFESVNPPDLRLAETFKSKNLRNLILQSTTISISRTGSAVDVSSRFNYARDMEGRQYPRISWLWRKK